MRDRFRVRYPELYKHAGLRPKASKSNKKPLRSSAVAQPMDNPTQAQSLDTSRPHVTTALPFDDSWLAELDFENDVDSAGIVLDRSIVDWAKTLPSLTKVHQSP